MIGRSLPIDVVKGVLTLGMVFAHAIQLLNSEANSVLNGVSQFTNLVSFSGFNFCFGYAAWLAYLSKDKLPWGPIAKTAAKCYFAFLISGLGFMALMKGEILDSALILKIALVRMVPGYSEFLISFALVIIISGVLAPIVSWCLSEKWRIAVACLICGLFSVVPLGVDHDPYVGLLIGGTEYGYFPVVQYMPLFLLGAYAAKHGLKAGARLLLISVAAVIGYAALIKLQVRVNRFPPSLIWIVASAALFYVYYCVAAWLSERGPRIFIKYLNLVGQNVLLYLLASNLVIFAAVALGGRNRLSAVGTLGVFVGMMVTLLYFQYISVDLKTAEARVRSGGRSA